MEILQEISKLLDKVHTQNPLIHQITNTVTINDCANITLALGGSPVMAFDETEVEEMVSHANALILNLGTIQRDIATSMLLAGKRANQLGIPVILDPVGVGATRLRTETARTIITEVQLAIIRGNLSEISVLAGENVIPRGVDAIVSTNHASIKIAEHLAKELKSVIAITGAEDIISDGSRSCKLLNGHPILAKITGTGCMATALIGTYSAVTSDYYHAAIAGILAMGLAGERAYKATCPKGEHNLGSFKVNLFDQIANLTNASILEEGKLHNL